MNKQTLSVMLRANMQSGLTAKITAEILSKMNKDCDVLNISGCLGDTVAYAQAYSTENHCKYVCEVASYYFAV